MTIMANNFTVMTTIKPGVVTVKNTSGGEERYVVFGGFADIVPAGCTLLAELAVAVKDVDRADLARRIKEAREDATDAKDDQSRSKAEQFLASSPHWKARFFRRKFALDDLMKSGAFASLFYFGSWKRILFEAFGASLRERASVAGDIQFLTPALPKLLHQAMKLDQSSGTPVGNGAHHCPVSLAAVGRIHDCAISLQNPRACEVYDEGVVQRAEVQGRSGDLHADAIEALQPSGGIGHRHFAQERQIEVRAFRCQRAQGEQKVCRLVLCKFYLGNRRLDLADGRLRHKPPVR